MKANDTACDFLLLKQLHKRCHQKFKGNTNTHEFQRSTLGNNCDYCLLTGPASSTASGLDLLCNLPQATSMQYVMLAKVWDGISRISMRESNSSACCL